MFRRAFLILLLLMQPALAAPFLTLENETSGDSIHLSSGVEASKVFFLDNPHRLVVDMPLLKVPTVALPQGYDSALITNARAGRFDPETVRIVFELSQKATLQSKSLDGGMFTIAIAPAGKASGKSAKAAEPAKPKTPEKLLIILDPGHGGDDPGTIGVRGTHEKDIVLANARFLRDALLKTGKYRVQLTRGDDRFIRLRERVKIARDAKAAIFISIHADSAPKDDARGLSIYTLSENASDAEAAALAAQENKADLIGGMDLSHEREDVADILISLAQRETRNQSAMLADMLVAALDDKVRVLKNPHRFAGFAVLKAPDVPSVLIEMGFLSHPEEEKLLKTKAYREKLVSGIVTGLNRYFAAQGNADQ